MDIDLYKLTVFCTVAETVSITKAAAKLRLTQPAVSIHINILENMIGTKLINREFGADRLTDAGEILYKHAKEILHLNELVNRKISDIRNQMHVDIRVGAIDAFENHILPDVVIDFVKRKPAIKLNVAALDTNWIISLLLSGDIDIGIIDCTTSKKSLSVEPLMRDKNLIIVPPRHIFAGLKSVPIRAVSNKPLILREQGSGSRRIIDGVFTSNGINCSKLDIRMCLTSPTAIFAAVESGLGISFASRSEIKKEVQHRRLVPLEIEEGCPDTQYYLVIAKNAQRYGIIDEFIDYLKSYPYGQICQLNHSAAIIKSHKNDLLQTDMPEFDSDRSLRV